MTGFSRPEGPVKRVTDTTKSKPSAGGALAADLPYSPRGLLSLVALIMVLAAYWLPLDIARDLNAVAAFAGHAAFTVLGIFGAIFANSTGAGGGVVFLPAFAELGFTESQAVSTSFGIQCFGMTAGALTWSHFYQQQHRDSAQWKPFLPAVLLCSALSATGLWLVYALDLPAPASVGPMFATFSLFLGAAILLTVSLNRHNGSRDQLEAVDLIALSLIAVGGGMVTAWLSVGVGEFIAFYLILRRYNATLSVAVAVVVSALTVWCAAPQHLYLGDQAVWPVIAFAGPGAVIGGLIARHLVLKLGAQRLKLFFGGWLLVIGLSEFITLA